MHHTFEHKGKQKTIEIPDEWLQTQKQTLKLTTREAIDLWLFDNDYVGNAEADALTAKAQASGAGMRATGSKRKAPTRKPDETKRSLIQHIYAAIQEYDGVDSPQVTNIERVIAFSLGSDSYEITLSKKRKPKN